MKKAAVVLTLAIIVMVSGTLYYAAGRHAMESACSLDGPNGPLHRSVSYSWSWAPLGFTCTHDDGTSETSLWPT